MSLIIVSKALTVLVNIGHIARVTRLADGAEQLLQHEIGEIRSRVNERVFSSWLMAPESAALARGFLRFGERPRIAVLGFALPGDILDGAS
jgi:hypothetical protein